MSENMNQNRSSLSSGSSLNGRARHPLGSRNESNVNSNSGNMQESRIRSQQGPHNPERRPQQGESPLTLSGNDSDDTRSETDRSSQEFQPRPIKPLTSYLARGRDSSGVPIANRDTTADIPPLLSDLDRFGAAQPERGGLLIWKPSTAISDDEVEVYLSIARNRKYSPEQALGLLYWHEYNVRAAIRDLKNFVPIIQTEAWGLDDKVIFEDALKAYGKDFHTIHAVFPDKSVASLVRYYYTSWKTGHNKVKLIIPLEENEENR